MDTIVTLIAAISASACFVIASQRFAAAREKLQVLRAERERDRQRH